MNIQSNLKNILDKFPKDEVKLESHKVELGLAQDLQNVAKTMSKTLDTANKVVDASIKVNVALKKVEKDSRFYNKYASITYENVNQDLKYLKTLMDKASSMAKELGVQEEDIDGYKKASDLFLDLKNAAKRMITNTLDFDI
jgi:DNA helicase TIP49 (TBP-interacting protein)